MDDDTEGLTRVNAERLAGLLGGRAGWRPEVEDDQEIWCFGLHGAARVVVTPEPDGFLMYVAEQDRSWVIPRLESVEEWLGEHEREFAGLSPLQEEFRRALEEREPGSAGA